MGITVPAPAGPGRRRGRLRQSVTRRAVVPVIAVLLAGPPGGCSSGGRAHRQAAPSTTTTTAPSSTTTATVRTVGDCSRPAGRGVAESGFQGFSAVKMVTGRRGWAVGRGIIAGTADGAHWSEQYSGPESFVGLDAVDAGHAWAVGAEHLFATTDGGRHWSQSEGPDPSIGPLQSVEFVDAEHGFGIAGFPEVVIDKGYGVPVRGGMLVATDDGGRTWDTRAAPCDAQAVCATDPDNAWLVAGDQVFRTHDAGGVWQPVLSVSSYRTPGGYLQCPEGDAAWVLRKGSNGASQHLDYVVYHTTDDGRTWNTVMVEPYTNVARIPGPSGPGSYPGPFTALGSSDAVFAGVTPPIDEPTSTMVATSGGRTLSPGRPVRVKGFGAAAASYLTAEQGWLAGSVLSVNDPDPGVIIATRDGGRTWQTQFRTG
jgi:photosystem II stability/assembly factor-like uncharacterized protein